MENVLDFALASVTFALGCIVAFAAADLASRSNLPNPILLSVVLLAISFSVARFVDCGSILAGNDEDPWFIKAFESAIRLLQSYLILRILKWYWGRSNPVKRK